MKKLYFLVLSISCLVFSLWLMWHTVSYDPVNHFILIGGKYWSDFGGHLPQIRSFSLGKNWPPEYPTFPGATSHYHFAFYLFVGLLERIGWRLDWALNLPSALGFFLLLVLIYMFSFRLFKRHLVSFLSVVFFLFNASMSWADFMNIYHINQLTSLVHFPSFGPWNGSQVSAFWNLNIYTNQRHLGLSFALTLLVIYLLYDRKHIAFIGFIAGVLLLLNPPGFLISILFIAWFFLFDSRLRLPLILSSLGGLPWAYLYWLFLRVPANLTRHLGFLLQAPVTLKTFLLYWFQNIGPHLILIPVAFLFSPKRTRILIVPLLLLFLVPNFYQFSVDLINNHKFFNFFLVIGSMFSAYLIVRIKPLLILLPLLILGGVIDLFPVVNDQYGRIPDVAANPDAAFFVAHTPPDAIVLNSSWFYHPASIAGRKIFNGYSYFSWALGYNQVAREAQAVAIYRSSSLADACPRLRLGNVSFVELNTHAEDFIRPNYGFWHTLPNIYANPESGITVYNVDAICLPASS